MRAHARFLPDPSSLVGTWRRFGPFGPAYRIDAIERVMGNGDTVFRVVVIGPRDEETLERLFSEILSDPNVA